MKKAGKITRPFRYDLNQIPCNFTEEVAKRLKGLDLIARVPEELQDLLELTPKQDFLFLIGDWNAKVGSQEIPEVTGKFGFGVRNEAGQRLTVLPKECTGHSKLPLPTTEEKTVHMDITRWSISKSD